MTSLGAGIFAAGCGDKTIRCQHSMTGCRRQKWQALHARFRLRVSAVGDCQSIHSVMIKCCAQFKEHTSRKTSMTSDLIILIISRVGMLLGCKYFAI